MQCPMQGNVRLVDLARLGPAVLVPGCALVLAERGGFYPSAWYPVALLLAAALLVTAPGASAEGLGRLPAIALAAAAGLAAWSFASLAWSGLPGATLVEANRAATYGIAIALVVRAGGTPAARRALLAAVAFSSGLLALYLGARLAAGGAAGLFEAGRLFRPIGYPNALAAFLMLGLWPLVTLAVSPERAPALRVAACTGAAAIPAAALLTASRAGALFAALAALVYLAASPLRLRALPVAGVAFGGCAVAWRTLERPQSQGSLLTDAAATAAGRAVLAIALAGAVAGALLVAADRVLTGSPRAGRLLRRAAIVACAVLVAGAGAVAVRRDAVRFAQDRWSAFTAGQGSDAGGNRLLTSGSNRYDFWRVALVELRERPLTGYGAGAWSWRYLQARRSDEEPANAHGTVWEVAADLGVPGLLLALTVAGAALLAALRGLGRPDAPEAAAILAALTAGLGHAQVDWLWETFPCGLVIAALIGLALAGARAEQAPVRPRLRRAGLVAVAACAVAIVPALLAERYTDQAWQSAPQAALDLAGRAATLNPFSAEPELARAAAAARAGDARTSLAAADAAAAREPRAWAAWLADYRAARLAGDAATAASACRRLRWLDPGETCTA
jgi:hypothetical protein